jgi:hypothetical protein
LYAGEDDLRTLGQRLLPDRTPQHDVANGFQGNLW